MFSLGENSVKTSGLNGLKNNKPLIHLLLLIINIVVAEYLVMEVLDIFKLPDTLENIIDSLLLATILVPFFYMHYKAGKTSSASEAKYRPLFENMLDGFSYCKMLYDKQGNPADFIYLDVNRAFEELTGLENVVGKKVTEVVPGIKESNPELFEIYGRVASTSRSEKFEIEIEPLRIWFSISAYSPANGYFVVLFDNVTKRKRMEEEREITWNSCA